MCRLLVVGLCALAACGRFGFDTDLADGNPGTPGLVASFTFETAPSDGVVGGTTGNAGTCNPTECPVLAAGHHGNAYRFDGANDCILVPDTGQLDAPTFTLALWLLQQTDGSVTPLSKAVPPMSNSWQIESDVGRKISFTTNNAGSHDFLWSASGTVRLGQWQHVAATWDGATKRLYVDGVLIASMADAPIVFDTHGAQIGCDDNIPSVDGYYDGSIDDLAIYDRALTSSEIATLASM
jgi:hypothetical protein